jgi:hypothetical protein
MKTLDIEWLKKIQKAHDRFARGIPIGSKHNECTQAIFIKRYFKFLENRTFKLKIKDSIYYVLFTKSKLSTVGTDYFSYSYGVQKYLGYNSSEFLISFFDEKLNRQEFKLHWNDIIRIEYEEIANEEYYNIVKLFVDGKEN